MSGAAFQETSRVMQTASPALNRVETARRYVERLRTLPPQTFACLHGKFLSCYEIYCDIYPDDKVSEMTILKCPSYYLMHHARRLGVNVRGVTSERVEHGEYSAAERRNPANSFVLIPRPVPKGKKRLPAYCRQPEDEVYYTKGEDTSLTTYHEHI